MNKLLYNAILHGFYNHNYPGHELLGPHLLENSKNDNIWSALRRELYSCSGFTWAVAFVTEDMLTPFKLVMDDLAKNGVSGTLITGNYLNFNSPKVFAELMKIPNLRVQLANQNGFHVKGYFFQHQDYETVILGSANFTRSALLANYEWALKVSSSKEAAFTAKIKQQLQELLKHSQPLTTSWLVEYQRVWFKPTRSIKINKNISQEIIPNQMQKNALQNLRALVKKGQRKGLVVSATGTGKTYLGAFAVKDFKPKRFLYVVHRRQIAEKSLASFHRVIGGSNQNFGLLSGCHRDLQAKYLFATVQTLSDPQILRQFSPTSFDYVLIDEAHRAAAPSYLKILRYLKPKFCLGMTATPERMDQQDVYRLFDYNLAYEIRLKDALQEKMLTPFHYVGIQDYETEGKKISESSALRFLTSKARVAYVLRELNYYGYSGSVPEGLIFCSRQEEAVRLARAFTVAGHPAQALTNKNSERDREQAVKKLESHQLEYIICVDLFNEGIDIPSLNQIIMLRNTQSSIVFTQQLGRGLRKFPGKNFVTVIDFIGNYKNNYLIPIALNGDKSRDQDQIRREVKIPKFFGLSTVNFSRVASERILHSLTRVKLDSLQNLKLSFKELQQKIGRVPLLFDFYQYGSTSPLVFVKNRNLAHYGVFLQKMGVDANFSASENGMLTFVTKELLNGKRPHELLLLKALLKQSTVTKAQYFRILRQAGAYVNDQVLKSVMKILSLDFFAVKVGKETEKKRYGMQPLVRYQNKCYRLSAQLKKNLQQPLFYKLFIDALKVGLKISATYDKSKPFTLYKKYSRKDVCRLLNWPLDVSAPMYGYRVTEDVTPIFITYFKGKKDKRSSVYNNQLTNGHSFHWNTRSPRHLNSPEVKRLLQAKMRIELFVKRNDATGAQFYYLGRAKVMPQSVKEEKIGEKGKVTVGMQLSLQNPLPNTVYELLTQ